MTPTAPIRRACCALIDADRTMEAEMVGRAIDPTGWEWYDRNASSEHPATQTSRTIFRDAQMANAERVLAALDIPARLAAARRDGMEAMRERALAEMDRPLTITYQPHRSQVMPATRDALMERVRALPLDPTPASAVAGGVA